MHCYEFLHIMASRSCFGGLWNLLYAIFESYDISNLEEEVPNVIDMLAINVYKDDTNDEHNKDANDNDNDNMIVIMKLFMMTIMVMGKMIQFRISMKRKLHFKIYHLNKKNENQEAYFD